MGARGAWFFAVALAIAAFGCGDEKPAASGGPAGSVIELEGTASATRGDPAATRDLAVGATIYGDDVIKTAADSRIAVSLTHNGARWQLGANLERRVDNSAAWRAPKGSTDESALAARRDDDRTMVAGRHGEKAAAETADTAGRAPVADKAADEGADMDERAVATADPAPAPAAAPRKPQRRAKPKPKRSAGKSRGFKTETASGRAGSTVRKKKIVIAAPAPKGDAARSPGGPGGGGTSTKNAKADSDSDGVAESAREPRKTTLGARAMSAQLLVRSALRHCQRTLAKSTAGKVSVIVDVGADGKLKVVSLKSSTNKLKEVLGCARNRLTNARAEKPKKPGKLRLTITLE